MLGSKCKYLKEEILPERAHENTWDGPWEVEKIQENMTVEGSNPFIYSLGMKILEATYQSQ